MKIGGFDPLDIAKNVGGNIAQDAVRRADPLNLFGGDSMTRGSQGSRANGVGGTGGIEDLLATLGSKKDKNNSFDAGDVGNKLFKAGTDAVSGSGGANALSGMMQGAMGQIMGLVKQLLPMIMGMLGGL
jgi:hypothetical protein